MKSITKILWLLPLGLVWAVPVHADSCGLRDRMERLERRIDRGIDKGQLTRREAHRLRRERREIRALARDFRDDGYLSRRECDILAGRVHRLSRHVRKLKHNDRDRYDRYDRYDDSYRRRHW